MNLKTAPMNLKNIVLNERRLPAKIDHFYLTCEIFIKQDFSCQYLKTKRFYTKFQIISLFKNCPGQELPRLGLYVLLSV